MMDMVNENNLRLMVGNEYFDNDDYNNQNGEMLNSWDECFPDMVCSLLSPPNLNFPKIITGYLYFNITIETFGYGLWRGSTLCSVPNYNMVFPSGYRMNDGHTYWGTDIQPNFGTVKNNHIGFFGSKNRDLLAEWGFYDNMYLNLLRDTVLEWFNMMNQYTNWYDKLFDSPKTLNVARGIEYGRQVANVISSYKPKDVINLGKQFLGTVYNYTKNHPIETLIFCMTFLVRDNLVGLALSEGLIICYMAYKTGFLPKWEDWKKNHGDDIISFAKFMANYLNPFNPDGVVNDLERETGREINNWKDMLNALWDVSKDFLINNTPLGDWLGKSNKKSWEDIYNELSKQAYNSIVREDANEITFMIRDCDYSMSSYDGWMYPKYHLTSAKNFKDPVYELRRLIFLKEDALIVDVDFDVNNLFNRPFTDLLLIKNYEGEYDLLSELIDSYDGTIYLCSSYPSYIQMQLYGIPKIKIE